MDCPLLVSQAPNGALSARRFPGAGITSFLRSSKLLHSLSRSRLGLPSQNARKPLHLTLVADGEPATSRQSRPFPTQDDDAVFVGDEGVPLEGVIQFDKPSTPSSLLSWAILALLAGGDVICLLAFSAIGRFSHGLPVFDVETLKTADPFVAGWVLSAYFLGGYGDDGKGMNGYGTALAAAARSWLVGIPLGISIRAATSTHIPQTTFILMAMGSTGILLLGWRAVACRLLSAQNNKNDVYRRGNPFELFESAVVTISKIRLFSAQQIVARKGSVKNDLLISVVFGRPIINAHGSHFFFQKNSPTFFLSQTLTSLGLLKET